MRASGTRWPPLWLVLVLAACAWGAWRSWLHREQTQPPGVLVAEDPQQGEPETTAPIRHHGYELRPLASFELRARVLGREDYRFDALADLVPTDLALGWGRMSDSAVLRQIAIQQSGRFYHWQVREFPIPEREIITHSANMHLIPADPVVARALARVRPGQIVALRGSLVEAHGPGGRVIRSSLTREDSGAGACEVIWVEDLSVETP